jgi:hypothetical protein
VSAAVTSAVIGEGLKPLTTSHTPVVAQRLPLAEARRAHEMLESSASKGKLVLVP